MPTEKKWHERVNWTFAGFAMTFVAFVMTTIVLIIGFRQNSRLMSHDKEIMARLENLAESTEITRLIANLGDRTWPPYLERIQKTAVDSNAFYLEPRQGKRVLTKAGRQLLSSELANEIENSEIEAPANGIILRLGIRSLYHKAKERGVPLDTMVAVVAAYIDEVKRSKKGN